MDAYVSHREDGRARSRWRPRGRFLGRRDDVSARVTADARRPRTPLSRRLQEVGLQLLDTVEAIFLLAVQIVLQDCGAATVVVIELLLKGFAEACNQHYLQLWRPAA